MIVRGVRAAPCRASSARPLLRLPRPSPLLTLQPSRSLSSVARVLPSAHGQGLTPSTKAFLGQLSHSKRHYASQFNRKNSEITAPEVMLIDETGVNRGKVPLHEALALARSKGLSLIQVSTSTPPVCRIADNKKLEQEIEDRLSAKQRAKDEYKKTGQKTKELRFGHRIEEHDVQTKVRKLREFLQHKYKVKVAVVFTSWRDFDSVAGVMMLNNILDRVKDLCKPTEATAEGRFISCYFVPDAHGAGSSRVQPPTFIPVQSVVGSKQIAKGPVRAAEQPEDTTADKDEEDDAEETSEDLFDEMEKEERKEGGRELPAKKPAAVPPGASRK